MDLSKIFEPDDDEIFDLPKKTAKPTTGGKPPPKPVRPAAKPLADEEDADFWRLPEK